MNFSIDNNMGTSLDFSHHRYEKKMEAILCEELSKLNFSTISEIKIGEESYNPMTNLYFPKHQNITGYQIKPNDKFIASPNARLIPNTCEFPILNASQDLLLQSYLFSRLRMDQVYMICSEARRVVKCGGYWGIIDHNHGTNFISKIVSSYWEHLQKHRNIDLTHYISPEDWEIIWEKKLGYFGVSSQILILKRIDLPDSKTL